MRSKRTRLAIAGDDGTAMFAAAADRLDWKVVAAAGSNAETVRAETRAKVVDLDQLVASTKADIAVVGTPPERRAADAERLLARGVGVILIPDQGVIFHPGSEITPRWVLGDPVPMAPAVQRWLKTLHSLRGIERVWITATPALAFSACSVAVLCSRVLGWSDSDRVEITLVNDDGALPRFDAQAAGPDHALTLSLFPAPLVEHNGTELPLPSARHPAEAFGTVELLRSFADDLAAGAVPILGAAFLGAVVARQENL